MEQILGPNIMTPTYLASQTGGSSRSAHYEGKRSPSPRPSTPTRRAGFRRRLSARGQQVKDEMKKAALEAQAYVGCANGSDDSSDDDDGILTFTPSFTKNPLPLEPLMPTITEESRSYDIEVKRTYSITIRSNSVRSHTKAQSHELPGFLNQARLEARIVEFDDYLEKDDSVPGCFRERLWRIRGVFEDFRAYRIRRDVSGSLYLLDLDLEVQVAYIAQANIKEFTHLLLHAYVTEDIKPKIRRYLRYSESVVKPEPDRNNNQVLAILKTAAASVNRKLGNQPPAPSAPNSIIENSTLRRDVTELRIFLQTIFLLRYEHVPYARQDRYAAPSLNVKNLRPLGKFIKWKTSKNPDVAISLAKRLDLHPMELERVLQGRLDGLLWYMKEYLGVEPEYVKARLCDSDNIWRWVNGHNVLAHNAQWAILAGQFHDDRTHFHRIFLGELRYKCPERGIHRSNEKARAHFGMIVLHGHYFARLESSTDYELSKNAKEIDRRFVQFEKRRRKVHKERQRTGRQRSNAVSVGLSQARAGFTRVKDWIKGATDSLKRKTHAALR
ncbi:MAG: hypothetical protein Q9166_002501 [cf. Caloplaca sp. 2 TL-2023]